MRRHIIIAGALVVALLTSGVRAETASPLPAGEIVGGINAYLTGDGEVLFEYKDAIRLENGRKLVQKNGKWAFDDPSTRDNPKVLSGLDFSAFARDYIGQVVKVTGGVIGWASSDSAILRIQGSSVALAFDRLSRDKVRDLIRDCGGMSIGTESDCSYNVVGVVAPSFSGFGLKELEIERLSSRGRMIRPSGVAKTPLISP